MWRLVCGVHDCSRMFTAVHGVSRLVHGVSRFVHGRWRSCSRRFSVVHGVTGGNAEVSLRCNHGLATGLSEVYTATRGVHGMCTDYIWKTSVTVDVRGGHVSLLSASIQYTQNKLAPHRGTCYTTLSAFFNQCQTSRSKRLSPHKPWEQKCRCRQSSCVIAVKLLPTGKHTRQHRQTLQRVSIHDSAHSTVGHQCEAALAAPQDVPDIMVSEATRKHCVLPST